MKEEPFLESPSITRTITFILWITLSTFKISKRKRKFKRKKKNN